MFQAFGQSQASNGGVSNDQYTGAMIAADHIRKFPDTAYNLRFAIRKYWQCQTECCLKYAAVYFFEYIHEFSCPFSSSTEINFSRLSEM